MKKICRSQREAVANGEALCHGGSQFKFSVGFSLHPSKYPSTHPLFPLQLFTHNQVYIISHAKHKQHLRLASSHWPIRTVVAKRRVRAGKDGDKYKVVCYPVGYSFTKQHSQLLSHNGSLQKDYMESKPLAQSMTGRKRKSFICWFLPVSCLSLVKLHPMGC